MASKKKSAKAEKRADPPLRFDYTKHFLKDWDRLSKSGRYDMGRLKQVMLLLIANDGPLGAEWKDHALTGQQWKGFRECHVGGDFLLVYQSDDTGIVFTRIGTHSELFQ